MTDNPLQEQQRRGRGRPFQKGQSGNPAGKPKGATNLVTRAAEVLLDGEAEKLTRKAIDLAMAGDTIALRLCLERLMPPRKSRRIAIELPEIAGAEDLLMAFGAVVKAMGAGELAPDEAATMAAVLEAKRKSIETIEIERRLAALEGKEA